LALPFLCRLQPVIVTVQDYHGVKVKSPGGIDLKPGLITLAFQFLDGEGWRRTGLLDFSSGSIGFCSHDLTPLLCPSLMP
jgi:hypothetical protein